jgi:hypothetical protein
LDVIMGPLERVNPHYSNESIESNTGETNKVRSFPSITPDDGK